MGRKVKAESIPLRGHSLCERPRSVTRKADRCSLGRIDAEQSGLPAFALVVSACCVGEDGIGPAEHRRAVGADAVEGARSGETFDLSAVQKPGVDSRREILETLERPSSC